MRDLDSVISALRAPHAAEPRALVSEGEVRHCGILTAAPSVAGSLLDLSALGGGSLQQGYETVGLALEAQRSRGAYGNVMMMMMRGAQLS